MVMIPEEHYTEERTVRLTGQEIEYIIEELNYAVHNMFEFGNFQKIIDKLKNHSPHQSEGVVEEVDVLASSEDAKSTLNVIELIDRSIKRNVPMAGGLPGANHIYRRGWKDALKWLKDEINDVQDSKSEPKVGCGKPTEFTHGIEKAIPWLCGEGQPDYRKPFLCDECQEDSLCVNCGKVKDKHYVNSFDGDLERKYCDGDITSKRKFQKDALSEMEEKE